MDGRTDIVPEAGQRQLGRARPPADRRRGLDHQHRPARARQGHGRGQPVRPRADDDGVIAGGCARHLAALNNRRTHRTGAATWYRIVRICALCQTLPARGHCTFGSSS